MTSTVYVVGAPGVGKSTLVDRLLETYRFTAATDAGFPPFAAQPMYRGDERLPSGFYLGRRRARFPGTDALSMAVLPAAIEWAQRGALPSLIVGEGDRLAHERFLDALSERSRIAVVYLAASERILAERRAGRGSNQDPSWAAGRATRARNVADAAEHMGWQVIRVYATATPDAIADRVRRELAAGGIDL